MTGPSESSKDPRDKNAHDSANKGLKHEGQPQGPPESWIDSLARRSAGLPADQSNPPPHPKSADTNLWKLAGMGLQFAGSTALFTLMGYALDKKMGWSPWSLVILSLLAIIGNLYLLIKETLKQDSPTQPTPKK